MNIATGYCTNVHAGADLQQTRANLERYAVAVKKRFSPSAPLGIGLWLSAAAARRILEDQGIAEFADWLGERGLEPFTFNGFPYGDFHQRIVKHDVYVPTWLDSARLEYTKDLIAILDGVLPEGREGSISTLPLQWGRPRPTAAQLQAAAQQLYEIAEHLAQLEQRSGRLVHLCLEPEPGCALERSGDIVRFFEEYLLPRRNEAIVRRHLRVYHDICHAAVMFEEQADVLERYRRAGLSIGKAQVSAAVSLEPEGTEHEYVRALSQLAGFDEPRYLHQTMIAPTGRDPIFFEDLPQALDAVREGFPRSAWRVHFHVPIYVRRFGHLLATQDDILACLRLLHEQQATRHFEVETYAWGVLPDELRQADLATGIADELIWFRDTWRAITG